MHKNIKTKVLIVSIIILTVLCLFTGYYAFSLREKYYINNTNNYTEAFSNLVNYVNNVENYLAKAMISKDSSHAAQTLTHIWRDSGLATVYLSRIPLQNNGLSQTEKFLNQVSDYSFSLSRKNIEGEGLTEEDFNNLKDLHSYSINLKSTLNQLSEDLYNGEIDWESLSSVSNSNLAQAVDNMNEFTNIDSNLNEFEGLIYDGAYSDHVNKKEKAGLIGMDLGEDEAKEKVKEFLGKDEIEKINSNGFLENAEIPSYDFTVKLKDKEETYSIMISKKGGHIVQSSLDREVKEEKISQAEANEIGKIYLKNKGFENMKETYFIKQGNIVTINYAYEDSGIIVYPDLIKVRVALDNGEILGIETSGYLNSHKSRAYKKPEITIEEARSSLNEEIEIKSEKMAVIPTEWKTELFCYEFKGSVEGKNFLVYINCETGEEEDILVILDTPGGTLTI